jgi:hypothetical protein
MDKISACRKKLVAGRLFCTFFAKLEDTLQHLLWKLAPCYNYTLDISAPIQI